MVIVVLIAVAFAAAVGFWQGAYKLALLMFTRGRITPKWNLPASIMCYLSLVPAVYLMSSGVVTLANQFHPVAYRNWVIAAMTGFVIMVVAPSLIARGKVYAIQVEEEAQKKIKEIESNIKG
jgi:hypothetical protein